MLSFTNLTTRVISTRLQCRHIHLVHEIWTKYPSGKLARCKEQKLIIQPTPFGLRTKSGKTITIKTVKEVLEHIEPMTHLEKLSGENTYRVSPLDPPPVVKKPPGEKFEKPGTRDGGAREVHLNTSAHPTYLKHVLSKAYHVLCFKDLRLRKVEFHVRTEKSKGIEWALENCPHLRPEVILAAMPRGTKVLAPPLADGETKLMWALHFGHIPPEMQDKKTKGDKSAKGVGREEKNPNEVSTTGTNLRESFTINDAKPALSGKGTAVEKLEKAQRISRAQKRDARTDKLLQQEVEQQARENPDHNRSSTKTSDDDGEAVGKDKTSLSRNEQLWDKPTRLFMRAWKREAYPGLSRTPEQALAKKQRDLARQAQNKSPEKQVKVKHKPKRKKFKSNI